MSGDDDGSVRIGPELRRRDVRDPHLKPGERLMLDFVTPPRPGDVVLVRHAGVFAVALAPAEGCVVAVVRGAPPDDVAAVLA